MPRDFDLAWRQLNRELNQIERRDGLGAALAALETNQIASHFIKDDLEGVQRRTFVHPDDPNRYLQIQYNPRRAARFAGAGQGKPPEGVHDGCFLCRENIQWQQQGAQLGYDIRVGEHEYVALMNPFPLLPGHVVIASAEHRSQDWLFFDGGGLALAGLLGDLVELADRLPDYVGFYNGVDAGASIPNHMHFQFLRRPPEAEQFPLEAAAAPAMSPGLVETYPLAVVRWHGRPRAVVGAAAEWVHEWGARNQVRLNGLTANFVATRARDSQGATLYFVPRDRNRRHGKGLSSPIGGLEVLGEIVLSRPEEKALLDGNQIDYFFLEDALAEVFTPLDGDPSA